MEEECSWQAVRGAVCQPVHIVQHLEGKSYYNKIMIILATYSLSPKGCYNTYVSIKFK